MSKALNELNFEVWYKHLGKSADRRLCAFHFRFDAENYINTIKPKYRSQYYVKAVEES